MTSAAENMKTFLESSFILLGDDIYKCRHCDKNIKQPARHGGTNLKSHMKCKHGEVLEKFLNDKKAKQPSIVSHFRKITEKAHKIFKWIQFVVMTNQSFSIVDNEYMRGICHLEPICRNTLSKYLTLVGDKVFQTYCPLHFQF